MPWIASLPSWTIAGVQNEKKAVFHPSPVIDCGCFAGIPAARGSASLDHPPAGKVCLVGERILRSLPAGCVLVDGSGYRRAGCPSWLSPSGLEQKASKRAAAVFAGFGPGDVIPSELWTT